MQESVCFEAWKSVNDPQFDSLFFLVRSFALNVNKIHMFPKIYNILQIISILNIPEITYSNLNSDFQL